jgi:hypothetical protein
LSSEVNGLTSLVTQQYYRPALQLRAIAPKLLAELAQLLLEDELVEGRLDDVGRR